MLRSAVKSVRVFQRVGLRHGSHGHGPMMPVCSFSYNLECFHVVFTIFSLQFEIENVFLFSSTTFSLFVICVALCSTSTTSNKGMRNSFYCAC